MTPVNMSLIVGNESITLIGVAPEFALEMAERMLAPEPDNIEDAYKQAMPQIARNKRTSRKLPKVDDSRSTFPTDGTPQELPEGVRDVDGKLVYRANYDCVNCGKNGQRYVWGESSYLKCHDCKEKLKVVRTVADWPDGKPVINDDGFYFQADLLYGANVQQFASSEKG